MLLVIHRGGNKETFSGEKGLEELIRAIASNRLLYEIHRFSQVSAVFKLRYLCSIWTNALQIIDTRANIQGSLWKSILINETSLRCNCPEELITPLDTATKILYTNDCLFLIILPLDCTMQLGAW